MIQVEGIFVGGGEATKSYTLEIKSQNESTIPDKVKYFTDYQQGALTLTTSYQTITCDSYILLHRDNQNNQMSTIYFDDENDNHLYVMGNGDHYGFNINRTGRMMINIPALFKDYPDIKKMLVCAYID